MIKRGVDIRLVLAALGALLGGCSTLGGTAEKAFTANHPGCEATSLRERSDLGPNRYEVTGCNLDVIYTCHPEHWDSHPCEHSNDTCGGLVLADCSVDELARHDEEGALELEDVVPLRPRAAVVLVAELNPAAARPEPLRVLALPGSDEVVREGARCLHEEHRFVGDEVEHGGRDSAAGDRDDPFGSGTRYGPVSSHHAVNSGPETMSATSASAAVFASISLVEPPAFAVIRANREALPSPTRTSS